LLPIAILAINNRISSVIGTSPFFVTYDYNIDPIKIEELLRIESSIPIAKGETFISKLKNATEIAQIIIAAA